MKLDAFFQQSQDFPKIEVAGGFRFVEYRSYQSAHRTRVWSESNFIIFVLQGQKTVEAGNGRFELTVDQALFLRKGAYLMSEIPLKRGVFQSVLFFIEDEFLERFAQRHADLLPNNQQASAAPAIRLHITSPVSQFYHAVLPYFDTPLTEARRRGLTLKLEELLLNLIAEPQNQGFALYLNGLLRSKPTVASVMEQNFRLQLPLKEFAHLAQRSLSAFKREFERTYEEPPGRWLRRRRLRHAAHLLQHTRLSVTQAALEAGFPNASHFSHAFKEKYGCSPSAYRKRASESKE